MWHYAADGQRILGVGVVTHTAFVSWTSLLAVTCVFYLTMASNGSTNPTDTYRQFFENFQSTVNINDPLPVKVGSHSIRENEVDGEIVDWTLQYLQQKYVCIR